MATSISSGSLISLTSVSRAPVQPVSVKVVRRRRKLSPEAGHAIEMLGHAIEYLADEFALDCMPEMGKLDKLIGIEGGLHPRLQTIELLKSRNREIYLSCPEVPTLSERIRSWLLRN